MQLYFFALLLTKSIMSCMHSLYISEVVTKRQNQIAEPSSIEVNYDIIWHTVLEHSKSGILVILSDNITFPFGVLDTCNRHGYNININLLWFVV